MNLKITTKTIPRCKHKQTMAYVEGREREGGEKQKQEGSVTFTAHHWFYTSD